ncbi:putative aldehyde dehydrogenase AldY [Oceanobacillus oncorhynchi subsp. incaldanensis]|uniref:Aldehyde dehydrogenase family protein n=1 Tax=Oceanobacillus aidingensis TaxID=645964 RepID=A0ABV9K2P4_9BACI|nr:aldehyde dehydrogenase family protein [Oceanobacillus oncorhynchi]MDM8099803.1 aldehyde dehydrogenase family protein [Oceanobacillus oncorhynchi]GIO20442.1 putative aldehyde dehydrogenase AldY [Oceanobacillus oncorhynchi subsp. incaldanensis]
MSNILDVTLVNQINKNFIGGKWVEGKSKKDFEIKDPYDGSVVSNVQLADKGQIQEAFQLAKEAQKEWKKTSADERRDILTKALNYLKENKEDIIQLIIRETGGTALKAEVEFGFGVGDMEDAIPMVNEIYQPKDYTSGTPNKLNRVYRLPLGVITSITPFNFPFNMATRTIFPALALGNTVVHKPDVQVGLVGGQIFAKAFEEAGLPAGVFNSILMDVEEAGDEFITNPNSDFISFTGSTAVGKHIKEKTGTSMKQVALELGGNNPLVILEDADVDQAVNIAVFGKFMHNGQICAITNRIIVHEAIYDEFVDKYVNRVKNLKAGDPKDAQTVIGPLINEKQADKVMGLIDKAKEEGIKVALEGERNGNVISPYVFVDVSNESTLASTEIFGPVAQVIPVESDEEAIRVANETEFGLSAAIITNNLEKGEQLALEIESGTTHVNDIPAVLEANVPFGGVKNSGIGRFGHDWVLEELTTTKWVSVQKEKLDYPF